MDTADDVLDLEFAYTPWEGSCQDLYSMVQACRRPREHEGSHACGYGVERRRWPR